MNVRFRWPCPTSADWTAERERLVRALAEHADAAPAPHTLYTLGTAVVTGIAELARSDGRRLHLHLAETADKLAGLERLVRDLGADIRQQAERTARQHA